MLFLKDVIAPRSTQSNCSQESNRGVSDDACQFETSQSANDLEIYNSSRSEQILQLPDESISAGSSSILASGFDVVSSDDEPLAVARARNIISQSASTSSLDSSSQAKRHKNKQNQTACSEFQKRMLKIEEEKIIAFKEKKKEADDEDMLFLKSLAPYFKYLSPVQKLRLKSKLQNMIADEIASAIPSPTSTTTLPTSISPSPVHASSSPSHMTPPPQTRQFYESFDYNE